MKLEIEKNKFLESLSIGGVYAGSSKILPILDCVKIKVRDDSINIISTDNENAISKKCDIISTDFTGDFCVGYKSLMQYVKLISVDKIEIILSEKKDMLSIRHDKGSLDLPAYNPGEFPILKMDDYCVDIDIESCVIHNWLVDAKNFIVEDILRPQLNGVYIYRRNGEVGCCGTDGHKMYCNFIKNYNNEPFEFIINKKVISSICSICKNTETVKVKIGKINTSFSGKGVTVISRNIEAKFPNHKSVISSDNDIYVVLDCKEFKEAILRCIVGANQASSLVKMDIKGPYLTLSAEDVDFSVKSVDKMIVECNKDITIGFKADYLLVILGTITTDKCLLKLKDETKAGLFYEYTNGEVYSNKLSLLMPMSI